jgi:hypothetical protein
VTFVPYLLPKCANSGDKIPLGDSVAQYRTKFAVRKLTADQADENGEGLHIRYDVVQLTLRVTEAVRKCDESSADIDNCWKHFTKPEAVKLAIDLFDEQWIWDLAFARDGRFIQKFETGKQDYYKRNIKQHNYLLDFIFPFVLVAAIRRFP